jgi:hypothetical protein
LPVTPRQVEPAVAARVGVLVNPANATTTESTLRDVDSAARATGLQIKVLNAGTSREIEAAFATLVRERPDALFVSGDPYFSSRRVQLVGLAARHTSAGIVGSNQRGGAFSSRLVSPRATQLGSKRVAACSGIVLGKGWSNRWAACLVSTPLSPRIPLKKLHSAITWPKTVLYERVTRKRTRGENA